MPVQGSCHCGNIAFTLTEAPTQAIECNCSICRRRGAILSAVDPGSFALTTSRADITTYTFGGEVIRHQVCGTCGCAPFAEGEMGGRPLVMVNLRCTEVDLDGLIIGKFDGASL